MQAGQHMDKQKALQVCSVIYLPTIHDLTNAVSSRLLLRSTAEHN